MELNQEYLDKVLTLILEENCLSLKRIPEVGAKICGVLTRLGEAFTHEGHLRHFVLHQHLL